MPRAQPKYVRARYACPFYGFQRRQGKLVPGVGNCCCVNSGKQCLMTGMKKVPNWNKCGFKNKSNSRKFKELGRKCTVFPEEFTPQDAKGAEKWKGISIFTWAKYVMNRNLPRP